ncbi:MAG TPA: electron transfer flavoprotein subunit alpha/FixB family protein [Saprospiraceae bacterium]|nr:electron transfer flavoprotein subunit alpha/FixB family protein [Saprospiraceae bacterium]
MVLVLAETLDGRIRKSALEGVYYGSKVADMMGTTCSALILGPCQDGGKLGSYGAKEIFHVDDNGLNAVDSQVYTKVISGIAKEKNAKVVIVSDSSSGRSILGRLAVALNSGSVRGVNSLPELKDGKLYFNRPVFSGKATATCRINSDTAVISLMGNSLKPQMSGSETSMTPLSVDIPASKTKVVNVKRSVGIVPLPEAEIVVSAGRGMKDPSNWKIIEELAESLGATTACSRPVADSGWRPHHEHVGQTGIAIRPNLYIAVGISGAIQHLAGVNSSKVIVVINKDPEAPFFKAADYGVVGDLFEVVPKLTEAIKEFKATHH